MKPCDPARITDCILEWTIELNSRDAIDEHIVDVIYKHCVPKDMNDEECKHVIEWLIYVIYDHWGDFENCGSSYLAAHGRLLWNVVKGCKGGIVKNKKEGVSNGETIR